METRWYKDAVVYQIYPRSFKDSNGDGIGDINGIIEKLDYLKELGVTCVWLSPVYQSPMDDNGYDISDYKRIHPVFGTMRDFKKMVQEMHSRGIRLIMDMVLNHTSDEHPWFVQSRSDENSPYREYYIWKKGVRSDPPNNWTGFFGEKAWEYDRKTDAFYLHLFGKKQPDLNWENAKVREELKDILRFWCDLGVDGFRLDVINLISKDQKFARGKERLFLKGRASYVNGPRLHEYLQELHRDVFSSYDLMTVGETVFTTAEDMKLLTDEKRNELSMVFNFDHTSVDNFFGVKWFLRKFSLPRFKKVLSRSQKALETCGWNSLFYENHDQRRSVGRFHTDEGIYREKSAKLLATCMYFLRGTPFIYQGQEIGMTNADIDRIEEYQDLETHNIYHTAQRLHLPKSYIRKTIRLNSRDNARTPMQWDDSEFAGFSDGKPWLKVNRNKDYINVRLASEDEDSILKFYQKLFAIRQKEPLVKDGKYFDLLPKHKELYAYLRSGAEADLLVIGNFSAKTVEMHLGAIHEYTILLNNYPKFNEGRMEPYQAVVLKLNKNRT